MQTYLNHFMSLNQYLRFTIILLFITGAFSIGYCLYPALNQEQPHTRATGLGGIFFKSKDPAKLREWYNKHLGLQTDEYGTVFEWRLATDSTQKGFTQWSPFIETTKYFEPSTKDFMINYRVADLEWLIPTLKDEGVTVLDEIETYDYGKFAHILDPEGNKIELWQPIDGEFDRITKARTK